MKEVLYSSPGHCAREVLSHARGHRAGHPAQAREARCLSVEDRVNAVRVNWVGLARGGGCGGGGGAGGRGPGGQGGGRGCVKGQAGVTLGGA